MAAEKFLSDVNPENYFYVCNGSVLKNLDDFKLLLENIDNSAFGCHVNESKNDFLNWVRDVVQDETLARNIAKSNTKEAALTCVRRRLGTLRRSPPKKEPKEIDMENKKPFKPVYLHKKDKKEIVCLLKKNP